MSSEKGNIQRKRPPKYQNKNAFKNNLYDKSKHQKQLNQLEFSYCCKKCKNILEWKVKYRKYKPLTVPRRCTVCQKKNVLMSYCILCLQCSEQLQMCAKCAKTSIALIPEWKPTKVTKKEVCIKIKQLSERQRRNFMRYLIRNEYIDNKYCKIQIKIVELVNILCSIGREKFTELSHYLQYLQTAGEINVITEQFESQNLLEASSDNDEI